MNIRWITPYLCTGRYDEALKCQDLSIIDIRNLVDKEGNSQELVLKYIQNALNQINQGKKIIITCDLGISRSNALAIGIICLKEKISFTSALKMVLDKTSEEHIKPSLIKTVKETIHPFIENGQTKKKSKKILITGGSGFIGLKLQHALKKQNYQVIAPSSSELDLLKGTTMLYYLIEKESVDFIIHLANPKIWEQTDTIGKTITMLNNVIDVCSREDLTLIYPSSWVVYSGYMGRLLADETFPRFPKGYYSESKYFAELLIEHYRKLKRLKCIILRFSNLYGLNSGRLFFVHNFIKKAINSEKIFIHKYLNGLPELDLLHIEDAINAFIKVLESDFIGDLNIGSGDLISTAQIAKIIIEKLESKSLIEQLDILDYIASIALNSKKAMIDIGWKPTKKVENGLEEIINYYSNLK